MNGHAFTLHGMTVSLFRQSVSQAEVILGEAEGLGGGGGDDEDGLITVQMPVDLGIISVLICQNLG